MSDTTNTAEGGAGAVAPADTQQQTTSPAADAPQEQPTPEQQEAERAEQQRQDEEAKRKNRTKEYIDRLKHDAAQARREADEARRELARRQGPTPTQHQPASQDTGPDLSQFSDFPSYQAARDAWVLEQAQRQFSETLEQRAQAAQQQTLISTYQQRADEFAATHDDFDVVVGSMPILPEPLQYAIAANPNGPAVLYHLANNPSDLAQIAALPPHFAEWGIAQVAARLGPAPTSQSAATAPAPKPITNAPPPAPTVGGRAATGPKDPDRMTTDEWLTWRNAQLKQKG